MSIRYLLFDFDGVIVDTEPHNAANLERAMAHFGITMSEEEKIAQVGLNDRDAIVRILSRAKVPVTPEELQREQERNGTYYECGADLKEEEGLRDALAHLRARGMKCAIVSSTKTRLIVTALNRLSLLSCFDCIVCGDMLKAHKPDPEGYLKAMELLGGRSEESLVIEDSPYGILAGKRAGCKVLAYKGCSLSQDTSSADFEFSSFKELPFLV